MMKMIVFKFLEVGHIEMIMRLQTQGNRTIRFIEIRVHEWNKKIVCTGQKSRGESCILFHL
jgi:hypothetical protein